MTRAVREKFLRALSLEANASAAARHAGVSLSTAKRHYREDAFFAQQWDDVIASHADALEHAVYERALHGVAEPMVTSKGEWIRYPEDHPMAGHIAHRIRYDSAREALLLKRLKPEEYRERTDSVVRGQHVVASLSMEERAARLNRLFADVEARQQARQRLEPSLDQIL